MEPMEHMSVLLDIQRSLGNIEGQQATMDNKLDEVYHQAKKTNGRVTKLESHVDSLRSELDVHVETSGCSDTMMSRMTWERWTLVLASAATVVAYIIERIA